MGVPSPPDVGPAHGGRELGQVGLCRPDAGRGETLHSELSRLLDERDQCRPGAICGALPRQENAWPVTVDPDVCAPVLFGYRRGSHTLAQRPEAGHARTHAWILAAASDNVSASGYQLRPADQGRRSGAGRDLLREGSVERGTVDAESGRNAALGNSLIHQLASLVELLRVE